MNNIHDIRMHSNIGRDGISGIPDLGILSYWLLCRICLDFGTFWSGRSGKRRNPGIPGAKLGGTKNGINTLVDNDICCTILLWFETQGQ